MEYVRVFPLSHTVLVPRENSDSNIFGISSVRHVASPQCTADEGLEDLS